MTKPHYTFKNICAVPAIEVGYTWNSFSNKHPLHIFLAFWIDIMGHISSFGQSFMCLELLCVAMWIIFAMIHMGDNNMVASDACEVDNGIWQNSQCWSLSAVSQVLICSIPLYEGKLSHLLQILVWSSCTYMHMHIIQNGISICRRNRI